MTEECVPARKKNGEIAKGATAHNRMREALEEREGPRPPGMICRHLCKNDSTAPNGFVCVLHTVWGTYSENTMDRSPETRARGPKIAGRIAVESGRLREMSKIGGRIAVESGQLREAQRIIANSPNNPTKLQVTCTHCGKTGAKMIMTRWHFDNCKHKSPSV